MRMRTFIAAILACALVLPPPLLAQSYNPNQQSFTPTAQLPQQALTTTGDVNFITQNTSGFSVRLSGTHGSVVAALQVTNDPNTVVPASRTWTTVPVTPVGGGAQVSSITADGLYTANAAGMTAARLHVTTMASGTLLVNMAGTIMSAANSPTVGDKCQSPSVVKRSAVINVGAATTTFIVDAVASQSVKVCGYQLVLAGTTPTFVFKTGTKVTNDCDTTPTSLTGVMAPVTGVQLSSGGFDVTVMSGITSGQVCGTTVGTGSSAQGVLVYVQD